ncbi:BRO-D [Rachiplusia nu nucleopolyhedrovirus]|uniref:BRO-D n=1 Tax=Rachiplusia nu nucleopolyhedrovirus TaxID=2605775 RepID=A0AAE6M6C7_9ABAC|nr:BRO-D [Rachiplusia nu nucleopolyhedrovirus]QEI03638.1 BRO-D [Rachiplusia nu nucleopolyhedrovirus]
MDVCLKRFEFTVPTGKKTFECWAVKTIKKEILLKAREFILLFGYSAPCVAYRLINPDHKVMWFQVKEMLTNEHDKKYFNNQNRTLFLREPAILRLMNRSTKIETKILRNFITNLVIPTIKNSNFAPNPPISRLEIEELPQQSQEQQLQKQQSQEQQLQEQQQQEHNQLVRQDQFIQQLHSKSNEVANDNNNELSTIDLCVKLCVANSQFIQNKAKEVDKALYELKRTLNI